jgi:hypothetical protein
MSKQARKAAAAAYREHKAAAGVFAVRCAGTGEIWVGSSRHLETQQNSLWFGLRHGGYPNRVLQAAWAAHGEPAFSFETLETFDPELSDYAKASQLKDRLAHWRSALAALTA